MPGTPPEPPPEEPSAEDSSETRAVIVIMLKVVIIGIVGIKDANNINKNTNSHDSTNDSNNINNNMNRYSGVVRLLGFGLEAPPAFEPRSCKLQPEPLGKF